MEIKELIVNIEKSKMIAEKYKGKILPNQCIDNMKNIFVDRYLLDNEFLKIRIAYGAMNCNIKEVDVNANFDIWVKHCFLINETDNGAEVIDPTIIVNKPKSTGEYIVAKSFSWDEYINLLEDEDYNPNFWQPLSKDYARVQKYLLEKHNAYLIG